MPTIRFAWIATPDETCRVGLQQPELERGDH
jgi:hypothetical protein